MIMKKDNVIQTAFPPSGICLTGDRAFQSQLLSTSLKTAIRLHSNGLFLFLVLTQTLTAQAQTHRPPPKPPIAPLIAVRYPNDADGDGIDDRLAERARAAQAAGKAEENSEAP